MIICIDPGHGGTDPGAVNIDGTSREKDYTLLYAKDLRNALLKYNNVSVIMTREDDTTTALTTRSNISNTNKADFFISLHHNAANTLARGFEILCYSITGAGYSQAQSIYTEMQNKQIFTAYRGIKENSSLAVLNSTSAPAVLIESGFIDNNDDLRIMQTKRADIISAITTGIAKYYNLTLKDSTTTSPSDSEKLRLIKTYAESIINTINQ